MSSDYLNHCYRDKKTRQLYLILRDVDEILNPRITAMPFVCKERWHKIIVSENVVRRDFEKVIPDMFSKQQSG